MYNCELIYKNLNSANANRRIQEVSQTRRDRTPLVPLAGILHNPHGT